MNPIILAMLATTLFLPATMHSQCGLDPTSGSRTINVSSIPNSYYPGANYVTAGASSINIGAIDARGNSSSLTAGDLIMIMQMQGADYNTTNTDSYGNGIAGGDASGYLTTNLQAGNYEYNSVVSVSGATINLNTPLVNSYAVRNFSSGTVQSFQVIKIPRDYLLIINAAVTLTAPAWNGRTGGVVALDAASTLTLNGVINVSGLGFRGGGGIQMSGATTENTNGSGMLTNTDYRWNSPQTTAANLSGGAKGEGICGTPVYTYMTGSIVTNVETQEGYVNGSLGRGAPGNAGGGSTDGSPVGGGSENQFNSGGGGGANGGSGGRGGSGWHGPSGSVTTFPSGGYGGDQFSERQSTRVIMGGGGGAGSANNSNSGNQYMSSGACGGGIIIIRAALFAGTGFLIADGGNAIGVTGSGGNTDAAGGGGGGGSIVAITRYNIAAGLVGVIASAKGGNGGNMETYYDHGPGGGGGGGVIITNGTFASSNITGGSNGFTRSGNTTNPITNAYGATSGNAGVLISQSLAPQQVNALQAPVACSTLPIKLISFAGSINNGIVTLGWEVNEAVNFDHFEIEYSRDENKFSSIGVIPFNTTQHQYHLTHTPVSSKSNYYRLKMIDKDGKYSYSNVITIADGVNIATFKIFPQPANEVITIQLNVDRAQSSLLQLYNISGSVVKQSKLNLLPGANSVVIDGISKLPAGSYSMKLTVDGKERRSLVMVGYH